MKLFYNERKHTLIRWNTTAIHKKVAPYSEFDADPKEAAELMARYPGKILEIGSPQHKNIMEKLKKGVLRANQPPKTKDVKETKII